jgi:hypothetical protein
MPPKDSLVVLSGYINLINYQSCIDNKLKEWGFEDFNVNQAGSVGIINQGFQNRIAFAKWVSPKRTRSYPFSRLYDIYHFNGQKVAIIPIIKDEGGDGDCDRINFITLSWLNLMGIYIILSYYQQASKKANKITAQKTDNEYIKQKIQEISSSKVDAHHWNNFHFQRDFVPVFKKAIQSYQQIEQNLRIKMHPAKSHYQVLEKYLEEDGQFSLAKFSSLSLEGSKKAATREVATTHQREYLQENSKKPVLFLKNNLGGVYYLTCDEFYFHQDIGIIQESKNTHSKLPSIADIKDGLFKLILFSQIQELKYDNIKIKFEVRLRLTGNFVDRITLPALESVLGKFIEQNNFSRHQIKTLYNLNTITNSNRFTIIIEPNA